MVCGGACICIILVILPELWCGAAGLCARVRACAGAAESLHTYIHIYKLQFLIVGGGGPSQTTATGIANTRLPLLHRSVVLETYFTFY